MIDNSILFILCCIGWRWMIWCEYMNLLIFNLSPLSHSDMWNWAVAIVVRPIINVTYSKSGACASPMFESSGGCVLRSPSRGVLVLPVSKHPLDMEPSEGEQGPQCLPAPCALSWRRLPPWLPAPNPTWHAWRWGKHLSHEHCLHGDWPSPQVKTWEK